MNCPACGARLQDGFLYVRGFASSLHWSADGSIRFYSRKGLEQIDLGQLSVGPTGGQATLPAARCTRCSLVAFKSVEDGPAGSPTAPARE